ncbi:hypothetical protein M9H77_30908 [Catharanthus roseus]|uniref:Uncharacterized protein n=1 Tax=Catharanthus roseus TaxID=4058 RepID=A0ACB9ZZJ0_CATRO|nr:hypothetical protein M9H77_30908 [Catharanthus roseus]
MREVVDTSARLGDVGVGSSRSANGKDHPVLLNAREEMLLIKLRDRVDIKRNEDDRYPPELFDYNKLRISTPSESILRPLYFMFQTSQKNWDSDLPRTVGPATGIEQSRNQLGAHFWLGVEEQTPTASIGLFLLSSVVFSLGGTWHQTTYHTRFKHVHSGHMLTQSHQEDPSDTSRMNLNETLRFKQYSIE